MNTTRHRQRDTDLLPTTLQNNIRTFIYSTIFALTCIVVLSRRQKSRIPAINAFPNDFFRRKAHSAYTTNARSLVSRGLAKFNGPFRILTCQGSRIILPASYTDWAKTCPDLDHQALVHDDFFASYPGFDGQAVVTNPDRILIDVTRTKLSQNVRSIQVMNDHVIEVLRDVWTDSKSWHTLDLAEDTMALISRMSASIFVGDDLARDSEWQRLTITYTVNTFKACTALRQWPEVLRPLVHRMLPQARVCREQVRLARTKVDAVLRQRERERDAALADNEEPRKQVLLDICLHPDLLQPMREEMQSAIEGSGWTMAALAKMQLVDSVLKESQRFKSAVVGIERKVIRPTTLPNGMKLPAGSIIAVDSSDMFSTSTHTNPRVFDGYRFLRMRQQGGKASSTGPFVSSTREHNTFGARKFICPGRFFVANEMKIALAHVLLMYDMRLKDGKEPMELIMGFYPYTDLEVQVEVRRREDDI